ncbi:hypothetical protein [Hymenobacter rubidus]|uniref:hypothetical protein n=1 Tax=Hymenobacter rubidus TaxID=1441626 RepID=UPI00191D63E0|nr:hypothetical protein [Hymenobacter rubidus]
MTPRFTSLVASALLALSTGCAGSYNAIRPDRINTYIPSHSSGPVELGYQFDVLRLRGNKKYVKKENKRGYHVAAVKVTNNWDRDVNFSRDLTLLYGDRSIIPMAPDVAAKSLRQGIAIYLLYLLLNGNYGGTYNSSTGQTTGGTYLPLGFFLTGGNMLGAGLANGNLRKEFERYDLTNRTLHPGETVYGIMSFHESSMAPIRLEMRGIPPTVAAPVTTPPVAAPAAEPTPSTPSPAPAASPAPATAPR